jgi:hypothetical protein
MGAGVAGQVEKTGVWPMDTWIPVVAAESEQVGQLEERPRHGPVPYRSPPALRRRSRRSVRRDFDGLLQLERTPGRPDPYRRVSRLIPQSCNFSLDFRVNGAGADDSSYRPSGLA